MLREFKYSKSWFIVSLGELNLSHHLSGPSVLIWIIRISDSMCSKISCLEGLRTHLEDFRHQQGDTWGQRKLLIQIVSRPPCFSWTFWPINRAFFFFLFEYFYPCLLPSSLIPSTVTYSVTYSICLLVISISVRKKNNKGVNYKYS